MDIADFRWLTEVSRVASVDPGSEQKRLTVMPAGATGVIAAFAGMHTSVKRVHPSMSIRGLADPISIPWNTLSGALALMPEAGDLDIRIRGANLIFASGGRKATVRVYSDADVSGLDAFDSVSTPIIVDTAAMLSVVRMMRPVTEDPRMASNAMLQGIHIERDGERLMLSAADGRRSRAMVSVVDLVNAADIEFDVVAHATDLTAAFSTLHGEAHLGVESGRLVLRDALTVIGMSTLNGQFPSFAGLPRTDEQFSLVLRADDVRDIVRAARIVSAESVLVEVSDKIGTLLTAETESGMVDVAIGEFECGDIRIAFGIEDFASVADIADNIAILIWSTNRPALTYSGQTYYWLMPMVLPPTRRNVDTSEVAEAAASS